MTDQYTFFYSTNPKLYPLGCKHYVFSQWFKSDFQDENGVVYRNMEQYMMASKAMLFKDDVMLSMIMSTTNPSEIKRLGRQINGFDDDIWKIHRFNIVYEGNLMKFSQNEILKEILMSTGHTHIVEASDKDKIWGIGLLAEKAKLIPPEKWPGLNLLGKALTKVRDTLRTTP